jgi:hypothetical protein
MSGWEVCLKFFLVVVCGAVCGAVRPIEMDGKAVEGSGRRARGRGKESDHGVSR